MTRIASNNKVDVILRDYQKDAIRFLNYNHGKLILAMCPSSGKTETIIYYVNQQYNINPNLKVLILPHSTNVLLDNFYERLESRNVDFTYSAEITDDVNVHVILPQNHNRIVGKYDLIIVDEAHENYFAKTIQGIIKKTGVQKEILLTGTPSKFIGNNKFKLHFVALSDLCESYIPKLRIDIIESDYEWNGNYNESKELKTNFVFKDSSTEKSLKKTFDVIFNRSKKNEKTIIVCRNINQSNSVKNYLNNIGISCEISNSENDKSSDKISDFKNNLFNILIVVNRARLGYDDADLINLIDMSGTLNPNIIYQMFARLLRGSNYTQKYYIRLTSKHDNVYNSEIATSVALMLTHRQYIQKFNGKTFFLNELLTNDDFFVKKSTNLKKHLKSEPTKQTSKKLLIETDDVISFFKEVIDNKEKYVGIYKFCKVQDVLKELNIYTRKEQSKYTFEMCIENALKYKTRKEWGIKDKNYYQNALKNGWLDECTAHMDKKMFYFTKEEVISSALQYTDRGDWRKNCRKQYNNSIRNNWLEECTAHMNKVIKHDNKSVINSALKYKTIKDWRNENEGEYKFAFRNNIIDECTAHMNLHFTKHTLKSCIKSASKYPSKKEWRKENDKVYRFAQRRGWLDECTAHMKKIK